MDSDIDRRGWRKSTYSGDNGGGCVEVSIAGGGAVAVRDSKNVAGPELEFAGSAWAQFVQGIKNGEFDR
jgi:Domain of unknown function (DUF397)